MLTYLATLLVEQERRRKDQMTVESGRLHQPSLLLALAKAYGRLYLLLGVLKLANDVLNFTGVQWTLKHQICCLLPCCLPNKSSENPLTVVRTGAVSCQTPQHPRHRLISQSLGIIFQLIRLLHSSTLERQM